MEGEYFPSHEEHAARIIIKKVKLYVTSFSSKFDGHTFISLKVISALQKKEKEGTRKKQTK